MDKSYGRLISGIGGSALKCLGGDHGYSMKNGLERDGTACRGPGPELLGGEADGCGLIPEVHFCGPSAPAPRLTAHTGFYRLQDDVIP